MGSPAAASSFAATGLGAFGKLDSGFIQGANQRAQAEQQAQGEEFKAQQLANEGTMGQAQASQTDAFMRQQTMTTLAHMRSVGASANTDSASPTNLALNAREQGQGDQARSIKVGDITAQAAEDKAESGLYTTAAQQQLNDAFANSSNSILGGFLGAGQSLLSGISGLKFFGAGGSSAL